jgi:hypothetical protein
VWTNVIKVKYGVETTINTRLEEVGAVAMVSPWWGNLCKMDKDGAWFANMAVKKLGRGNKIKFWKEVWVGEQSLQQRFPRLFGVSLQQESLIHEMRERRNEEWRWELLWRRNFFVWERELLRELEELIRNVVITEVDDKWMWRPNGEDGFSVKSTYVALDTLLLNHNVLTTEQSFAFKIVWKSAAPSKVRAMVWQLLLDRIPTKENLYRRRIIQAEEALCLICARVMESANHLFLHCNFAASVWYAINRWLDVLIVLPPDVTTAYVILVGCGRNRRIRKGFSTVWLAYIWVLWKMRNDRVFNNVDGFVERAVDDIQRTS